MKQELQSLQDDALAQIKEASNIEALKDIERNTLGKKGQIKGMLKGLKDLSIEEKKDVGAFANQIKKTLEAAFKSRALEIEKELIDAQLENDWIDLSAPGIRKTTGHIHPLFQTQEEVEEIFSQMGFTIIDGPEIESELYNFEGLNISKHHPARDMTDTFFMDKAPDEKEGSLVLRTHTSPNQVRAMLKFGAPLRIIVPGRVFRNEALDATHEHTFDQVEGLLIDENISVAHLKGVMEDFLSRLFEKVMHVRFRPGYFPFVEPGIELDMSCIFCEGKGCRTCKKTGWIEFMGCGMVHPNVLKAGGVDPNKHQGWAFGFGLTRLVMMRYALSDIRYLTNGDLRINQQF
jgi:phenylalanyl-tRNA synthetase alpha chain